MESIKEQLAQESAEEHSIRRWRFDQFLALGFDYATAATMVDAPIDLATARRLIALGCPAETASRILL